MELISLLIGLAVLVATVVGLVFVLPAFLEGRRNQARQRFREDRRFLKSHRVGLARDAMRFYRDFDALPDVPMLLRDTWLPPGPLPLSRVRVEIADKGRAPYQPPNAASLLPPGPTGRHFQRYSDAVSEFDRPTLFTNGVSYRLIDVSAEGSEWRLDVAHGRYFDMLDSCEVLGLELAAAKRRGAPGLETSEIPNLRARAGDPFDLLARCVVPGVNTLTIRLDGNRAGFFMHRRSSSKVAAAMGVYHVAPAGEFQPAGIDPTAFSAGADLRLNIIREFAEEFLGVADAAGKSGRGIDYERDEPYASIMRACLKGSIRLWLLGIGVDPLTLKAEILTAAVVDGPAFNEIFGSAMKVENDEGTLIVGVGQENRGIPFTAAGVDEFISGNDVETLPAGSACLALAWRWREVLLAPPDADGRPPEGPRAL
jgi:hypothetical protein